MAALGTGGAATAATAQWPAAASSLVLDSVTVVDVERGTLLPVQRVVVVGNRIQKVGSPRVTPVPKDAKVVDARGQYLIPGLWDMHTHFNDADTYFYNLFIAHGVTGIRSASSSIPLDTLVRWRREIAAGARVGPPRQLFSGKSINEQDVRCAEVSFHVCIADSIEARQLVDLLKAAGADMIKTYALSPAMYFILAAEARRAGLRVGGHAEQVAAIDASDSGASIVDHLQWRVGAEGILARCLRGTDAQCQSVAERFRRNGTWWVPTLALYAMRGFGPNAEPVGASHSEGLIADLRRHTAEFWSDTVDEDAVPESSAPSQSGPTADSAGLLDVVRRVGLPILAGTDVAPGFMKQVLPGLALHTELAVYVAEGLTPLGALQSATLNPARLLDATDSLGTIAPGKLADLVLLDADPLADIANTAKIRAVVANGRYFDRVALDSLLAEAQHVAKAEAEETP